jgi:hypothetical protein
MALEEDLWQAVHNLNAAWLQGDWKSLESQFNDAVVMSMPGFQQQIAGKDVLVQSYKDFVANAEIVDFQERDPVVNDWGTAAMLTYTFNIHYIEGGTEKQESGSEILLFLNDAGGWKVAWRTMAMHQSAAATE